MRKALLPLILLAVKFM